MSLARVELSVIRSPPAAMALIDGSMTAADRGGDEIASFNR